MLAGIDGSHNGIEVAGHADAHGDHVDVGMLRQFHRVGEGVGGAVMAGGDFGRGLFGGADGDDVEIGQREERGQMGDRRETTVRRDAHHADANLVCHVCLRPGLKAGTCHWRSLARNGILRSAARGKVLTHERCTDR